MREWEPFRASLLKIDRAKRHISELNSEIEAFSNREPYRIVVEANDEGRKHSWTLRVREEMPCHFPIILGDAVHNLRASLDLLACDLVQLNAGDTTRVQFPFSQSGDDFGKAIKDGHIDRASPEVIDIIRSLKPYKGGNDALLGLHDLDIMDKHKLLIPIMHHAGISNLTITGSASMFLRNITTVVEDGARLITMPAAQNIKVGQEFKAFFKVVFDKGQPFQYEPLVPTLHQLTERVAGIVETFAKVSSK